MKRSGRQTGYTLMEMVSIVVLLLIRLSIVIVKVGGVPLGISLAGEVNKLRSLMAETRREAVGRREAIAVVYDPATRGWSNGRKSFEWPEGVTCRRRENQELTEKTTMVTFYPDGRAGELTLTVGWEDERRQLLVSPLTGSVQESEMP